MEKMTDKPNFCVESLRGRHENNDEWGLRRTFLLLHKDAMAHDQLVCMANCFINVTVYGCRYPDPVMQKLQTLTLDMKSEIKHFKETHQKIEKIEFVKQVQVVNSSPSKSSSNTNLKTKEKPGPIAFVKSTNEFKSTDIKFTNEVKNTDIKFTNMALAGSRANMLEHSCIPIDSKFCDLQKHVHMNLTTNTNDNAISVLYMAADRTRITISVEYLVQPKQHVAILKADFVEIAKQAAATKKAAKKIACEAAVNLLLKKFLWLKESSPNNFILNGSDTGVPQQNSKIPSLLATRNRTPVCSHTKQIRPGQKRKMTLNSNFVLYEPKEKVIGNTEVQILNMCANYNQASLTFDCERRGAMVFCQIVLEGEVIGEGTGQIERDAKAVAATKALFELRKTNYTVQLKPRQMEEIGITKDELEGPDSEQLPESNIGNKLLKMMGWTGGGIGKEGQGIAEPVSLDAVINREGLGLKTEQGIAQDFRVKIKKILLDYAKSNDEKDLVFSPQFNKNERVIIHKEGQALRLKTKSFNQKTGSTIDRYLVVSRKRGRFELVQYLQSHGGENERYLLVPPGTHEELFPE